ncbi:cytochrome P450 [Boletus reticuloceps]|uniref:Cytochrome P450 n=1 Tax=Boletus reticuloceps TaxID=495285 RepID=A0A8I2YMM7_9AGAM|nr:cytochrome P450 [Boletus reticuloceps]KAG6375141.1 cytochrome P450 [Boletus reticuloceps]
MNPVGKLLCAALASVTAFGLWTLFQFVYHQFTSPIRHLRGPKGTSWIYGNMRDIWNAENSVLHEGWVKQYGNTLKYKGFFNSDRLFTMDTRAINHVLTHSSDYEKPSQVRYNLSQILGEGLLFVEGSQHRQQRHIMNPAFGPAQIRALTDIFLEKALRLRDVLSSEIAKDPTGTTPSARIDIMPWLSRMALDVIGLAGFNYNFDSLNANEKPNELNEAFSTMVDANQRLSILTILRARLPPLRILPNDRARRIQVARRTMARIGNELLSDAKAAARASATEKGEIEKHSLHGRDLLSLLVKANMATDIPESQRLSDEDVLAQVPTFLVAGHETTSTAITWALYAMTKAPEIQVKLREELLSVDTETPSMDELMALPYLDAVVRETLRVHSPVPSTLRFATKDDVIPIEKPYTDKYGVMHDSIRISKGDPIFIPILALNRSTELWGPDAQEFMPERWQSIPEAISHIPGVWGHLMTFLGGPRACIGYRFSLVEMKAVLFTLVRAFEFELAVPVSEIGKKSTLVQRPVLRSDPNNKSQLPLLIKPYKRT